MKLHHVMTLASLTLSATLASAGPRVGNGGGAWVCRDDKTNQARWMQLVDLFEATHEFNLTLTPVSLSATAWSIYQDRLELLQKVSKTFSGIALETQNELSARLQMLPAGTRLTEIDDALIRVRPSPDSCLNGYLYYGQLANFTQDGRLLIDGSSWNQPAFGVQGQGSLLVHEAVYKALRDRNQEPNSARSRQIVGLLFSALAPEEIGARIEALLAIAPIADESPRPARCVAQVQTTSRDFQLADGVDSETIAIGDFEFTVVVDLKDGKPTNLEIHNLKTDQAVKRNDFGATEPFAPNPDYSLTFPADGASLSCVLP